MNIKIKKRHIFVAICALLLIAVVKICEADKNYLHDKFKIEETEKLKHMQETSDSLLQEVIRDTNVRRHKYGNELDSLNKIILNNNLKVEQMERLHKKISKTENLLEEAKNERDTIILVEDSTTRDYIIYNVIVKDSIVNNIIEKDSIIYKLIYKIDTVCYNSNDIKKLKLKKD